MDLPRSKKRATRGRSRSRRRPERGTRKKPAKGTTRRRSKKAAERAPEKATKTTGTRVTRKTATDERKRSSTKAAAAKRQRVGSGTRSAPKKAIARTRHSTARMKELRAMLEAKRAEVVGEIKRAWQDSMETDRTSFPEVGDLVSASVEKEKAFEYGEAGVNALREINAALEKLESGTYGICEICGRAIGVKRLKVVPSARLCIKCKSDQEASGGPPASRNTYED